MLVNKKEPNIRPDFTPQVITIKGARTHNLKNIDVTIKLKMVTCFTGPSGSGKTSLVFHTLFNEAKRRFLNTFSTDVKFFWDIPQVADVDSIVPILPTWVLPQNNPILHSRINVSDILEIEQKLSKIFFNEGVFFCPKHKLETQALSLSDSVAKILRKRHFNEGILHVLAQQNQFTSSFLPARSYDEKNHVIRPYPHDDVNEAQDNLWEIFRLRLEHLDKLENKIKEFNFSKYWFHVAGTSEAFFVEKSEKYNCPKCDFSAPLLKNHQALSGISSLGACQECKGQGVILDYDISKLIPNDSLAFQDDVLEFLNFKRFRPLKKYVLEEAKKLDLSVSEPFCDLDDKKWDLVINGKGRFPGVVGITSYLERKKYKKPIAIFSRSLKSEFRCEACLGSRVRSDYSVITLNGMINNIQLNTILTSTIANVFDLLSAYQAKNAMTQKWLDDILVNLKLAMDVGLSHLKISEVAKSLTASEYQRLLLVKYLSFNGSGSLFIFDEPSVGLTLSQQKILMDKIHQLKARGNTILIIDHSDLLQRSSDEIIELGPGAGAAGGQLVYQGPFKEKGLVGYSFDKIIPNDWVSFEGFEVGQLPLMNLKFPVFSLSLVKKDDDLRIDHLFSGLSDFINGICRQDIFCSQLIYPKNGKIVEALSFCARSVSMGRRSTIGTLLDITPFIRKHYTSLPISKSMNLREGHFSSNSNLGKCISCDGTGVKVIEMQFMEDVVFTCDDCKGMKLKPMYAKIDDGHCDFYHAVTSPLGELEAHIKLTPKFRRILDVLKHLGLGHLSADRSFNSLSGGEKQRLLLGIRLTKKIQHSLLMFENISTGLSLKELVPLASFLNQLAISGNTIIIYDHNPFWERIVSDSIHIAPQYSSRDTNSP